MSPPGYQAPVMKASRCGNERQERFDRKAGKNGSGQKSNVVPTYDGALFRDGKKLVRIAPTKVSAARVLFVILTHSVYNRRCTTTMAI